jgi:hypothetical protein
MLISRGDIRESSNPGAMKWAQFFNEFYIGGSSAARDVRLKGLWATAETASTEYGRTVPDSRDFAQAVARRRSTSGRTFGEAVPFGTTPLTLGNLYAGLWPELFDPRVPSPVTMNLTMRIYLSAPSSSGPTGSW